MPDNTETLESLFPKLERELGEYGTKIETGLKQEISDISKHAEGEFNYTQQIVPLRKNAERLEEITQIYETMQITEHDESIAQLNTTINGIINGFDEKLITNKAELEENVSKFESESKRITALLKKKGDKDIDDLIGVYSYLHSTTKKYDGWEKDDTFKDDVIELRRISKVSRELIADYVVKEVDKTINEAGQMAQELQSKKGKEALIDNVKKYRELKTNLDGLGVFYQKAKAIKSGISSARKKKVERLNKVLGNTKDAFAEYKKEAITETDNNYNKSEEFSRQPKTWHHQVEECNLWIKDLDTMQDVYTLLGIFDKKEQIESIKGTIEAQIAPLEKEFSDRKRKLEERVEYLKELTKKIGNAIKEEDNKSLYMLRTDVLDIKNKGSPWEQDNDLKPLTNDVSKRCNDLNQQISKYVEDKTVAISKKVDSEMNKVNGAKSETIDQKIELDDTIIALYNHTAGIDMFKDLMNKESYDKRIAKINMVKSSAEKKIKQYESLAKIRTSEIESERVKLQIDKQKIVSWGAGKSLDEFYSIVKSVKEIEVKYNKWGADKALKDGIDTNNGLIGVILNAASEHETATYNNILASHNALDELAKSKLFYTQQDINLLYVVRKKHELAITHAKAWSKQDISSAEVKKNLSGLVGKSEELFKVIDSIKDIYVTKRDKTRGELYQLKEAAKQNTQSIKTPTDLFESKSYHELNDWAVETYKGIYSIAERYKTSGVEEDRRDEAHAGLFSDFDESFKEGLERYKGTLTKIKKTISSDISDLEAEIKDLEEKKGMFSFAIKKKLKEDQMTVNEYQSILDNMNNLLGRFNKQNGN